MNKYQQSCAERQSLTTSATDPLTPSSACVFQDLFVITNLESTFISTITGPFIHPSTLGSLCVLDDKFREQDVFQFHYMRSQPSEPMNASFLLGYCPFVKCVFFGGQMHSSQIPCVWQPWLDPLIQAAEALLLPFLVLLVFQLSSVLCRGLLFLAVSLLSCSHSFYWKIFPSITPSAVMGG